MSVTFFRKSDLIKAAEACCRRFRSGKRGPGKYTGQFPTLVNKSLNVFNSDLPLPSTYATRQRVQMGGKNGSPIVSATDEHNPHEDVSAGSLLMEVFLQQYDDTNKSFYDNYAIVVDIRYGPAGSSLDMAVLSMRHSGQKICQFKFAEDGKPIGCNSAADVVHSLFASEDLVPLRMPKTQRPWTDFESRLLAEALYLLQDIDGGADRQLPPITVTRLNGDKIVVEAHPDVPKGEVRGGSIQAKFNDDWKDFSAIQVTPGSRHLRRYTSWHTVMAFQESDDFSVVALVPMPRHGVKGAFFDLCS